MVTANFIWLEECVIGLMSNIIFFAKNHKIAKSHFQNRKKSHTRLHPDLIAKIANQNIIKKLWDMLEQQVKRGNQHFHNLGIFCDQIFNGFVPLDAMYPQNLVDSLPDRIPVVIKSKNRITLY